MKGFLIVTACFIATTLFVLAEETEETKKPNIIIILADDLGFSDLGCYGGEIHTPNLDKLANEGLRFTQFYNASKCEQTRASLLSGFYWQEVRRGIRQGVTMGQALHAAGYTTIAVGKWHLDGNPVERGFDRYFGFLGGLTNYFRGGDDFRLDHDAFVVPRSGFYSTDAFTDYAIRFLDDARKKSPKKPFFLYLAYNAPHAPLQAPAEAIARYSGKYLRGWDVLRRERYERQISLGVIKKQWELSPRPDNIPGWDSLDEAHRKLEDQRMAVYAAMVDRMDEGIGHLLGKLTEWRLAENTLVIFLSDNGGDPYDRTGKRKIPPGGPESEWEYGLGWANLSDTPFRFYKRNQHEGGTATPFIVRWPAVIKKGGGLTDQTAHIIDLMATCVQLSGCDYQALFQNTSKPPAQLEGTSLVPIFTGEPWSGHDALFFQLRDHRAVRAGEWKLTSHEGKPWELYQMTNDRTEVHDLSAKNPAKVKELEALYEKWWNSPRIIIRQTHHDESPNYVDPFKGPKTWGDKGSKVDKSSDDE